MSDPEQPDQRRGERAQAGDELRQDQRAGAVAREEVLGPPYAGVRLQRNAAQEIERLPASMTAQLVPDHVAAQAGHDGE